MHSARKQNCKKNNKVSKALLKMDRDGKIKYNHLQLSLMYKTLMSLWTQKIQKAQSKDEDLKEYASWEATHIPKSIAKEFVKDFYENLI